MWVFARARAKLSPITPDYGQAVGSKLPSLTTVALVQTRYAIVYARPSHSRQAPANECSNRQGKPWGVGTRLDLTEGAPAFAVGLGPLPSRDFWAGKGVSPQSNPMPTKGKRCPHPHSLTGVKGGGLRACALREGCSP